MQSEAPAASATVKEEEPASGAGSLEEDEDNDMDEDLAAAMALSMDSGAGSGGAMPPAPPVEGDQGFLDPAFVREMLGDVDIDPNDPLMQAALAQVTKPDEKKEEKDSKKRNEPEN